MNKKPDLVVFNEETKQYDAALKPYGTSASSPVIKPLNTATWRNDGVQRVNKQFKSKFDEVRKEYEELIQIAKVSASFKQGITIDSSMLIIKF